MRLAHIFSVMSICVLLLVASGCQGTRSAPSKIEEVLQDYGYAAYTPFRTSDLPGTIFVLARDHRGRTTELSLANYTESFRVPGSRLFSPEGQVVEAFDKLEDSFAIGGSVAANLLTAVLGADVATKWSQDLSIRFADPKKTHTMSLARLAEVQGQLSDDVKLALRDIKERGQLESVYIVLETLQVGGIEINLTIKDEFKAEVNADKIKDTLKVAAAVNTTGGNSFSVKCDQPLLIGYKAITFPSSILRNEVSVGKLEGYETPSARDMNAAK